VGGYGGQGWGKFWQRQNKMIKGEKPKKRLIVVE
jgi:hypothetical protein